MRYGKSVVFYLLGALAFSLASNAGARETIRSVVTTEAIFRTGAPEVHEIQRWLVEHAAYVKGAMVGDPGKLGDVQIVYTANLPDSQIMSPGDGPPVPLPPTGSPGDEITITSSSGGWTQTWSYRWVSGTTFGRWVLFRYEYFQTMPR